MLLPSDIEPRSFLGQDAVSFSEIGTLARCEQAWKYSYDTVRERTPPSAAMALGSETHRLVQAWHMGGGEGVTSDHDTALWLANRYIAYYADSDVRCIDVEVPIVATLPTGQHFFGFADMLVAFRRELWVGEIKTTQTLSNAEYLAQQLQTRLYVWALRQMGVPVVGAMLDVIRSYRPVRKELELSESFDRTWMRWSNAQLVPAVAEAMSAVQVREQLQAPAVRVPIRNVGSSCSWCNSQAVCFGLDVTILEEDDAF